MNDKIIVQKRKKCRYRMPPIGNTYIYIESECIYYSNIQRILSMRTCMHVCVGRYRCV
jgi:hypothetical protein